MGRVRNSVAIVTGGANGNGRAIACMLAKEGAKVAVFDVKVDESHETIRMIEQQGGQAGFWKVDITKIEQVKHAVDEVADRFGNINILVNNAAITGTAKFTHEASDEEFDQVFSVNVKGTFLCTKHVIPHMLSNGGGSIVNISSTYGIVGNDDIPLYHATKGAIRLMTKTDAVCYAKQGIRVNSIHPGSIRTPMSMEAARLSPEGPEQYLRKLTDAHPMGRQGVPDDIAYGVLYLASNESAFVTGTELIIDGGYTAQ